MRALFVAVVVVVATAVADAHVTVWPMESRGGAGERYTVRVPTRGQVATVSVELDVPADVTVSGVLVGPGYTYALRRDGDRITGITWTQEIKPREYGEFVFFARTPMPTRSPGKSGRSSRTERLSTGSEWKAIGGRHR
jgi:uncharacterized protein YcnI